jgi:hypothetical protein
MKSNNQEIDYDKGLWQFTLREFLKAQTLALESSIQEMLLFTLSQMKSEKPELSDNIGIDEAEGVTGYKAKSIYTKVSRMEMPVIMRGRPLMFSRAELLLWMKLGKPKVADWELMKRKGDI